MDLNYNLYLERANNEIKFADIALFVSNNKKIQTDVMKIEEPETYYSSVISHSYYCIFYSAKAYLAKKGIKTEPPEEHKKIYDEIIVKADTLLGIFKIEKKKRGEFTYQKLVQANLEPANKSLENAKTFLKHIRKLCE